MKIGLLTISDRGVKGEYEDRSGPLMAQIINANTPWDIIRRSVVPDEFESISRTLLEWSDDGLNLILTSGGTGFAPRDITPEATASVISMSSG